MEKEAPMSKLDDVLLALAKEVVMGRSHLWNWWCLCLILNRKPELLQKGPVFLGLTLKAHINESWLSLAKLYDKTPHTITIASVIELAEKHAGQFKTSSPEEVRQLLKHMRREAAVIKAELWNNSNPIGVYRREVIAHMSQARLGEGGLAVLQAAAANPDSIRTSTDDLYRRTQDMLNNISVAYDGTGITDFQDGHQAGSQENSEICALLG
jgi:AbiU2